MNPQDVFNLEQWCNDYFGISTSQEIRFNAQQNLDQFSQNVDVSITTFFYCLNIIGY
jgi:hypothetical protein